MHTWVDIATLTKKRVQRTRFVARKAANLFYSPEVGVEVAFVPPRLDAPRRAHVAEVTECSNSNYEVVFDFEEGPWDEQALEALVGCHCLVRRTDMDAQQRPENESSVEGMNVVDAEAGALGTALAIESYPGQDMLVVRRPDGAQLLIPFVEALVTELDFERGLIQVALPSGLIELSQGSEEGERR